MPRATKVGNFVTFVSAPKDIRRLHILMCEFG